MPLRPPWAILFSAFSRNWAGLEKRLWQEAYLIPIDIWARQMPVILQERGPIGSVGANVGKLDGDGFTETGEEHITVPGIKVSPFLRSMERKQKLRLAIVSAIVVFLCRKILWRYSFTGKRIVITGGSRGLGLAIARRLAREGAILAILARDTEELARAKADLEQHGGSISIWRCDVTEFENLHGLLTSNQAAFVD